MLSITDEVSSSQLSSVNMSRRPFAPSQKNLGARNASKGCNIIKGKGRARGESGIPCKGCNQIKGQWRARAKSKIPFSAWQRSRAKDSPPSEILNRQPGRAPSPSAARGFELAQTGRCSAKAERLSVAGDLLHSFSWMVLVVSFFLFISLFLDGPTCVLFYLFISFLSDGRWCVLVFCSVVGSVLLFSVSYVMLVDVSSDLLSAMQ